MDIAGVLAQATAAFADSRIHHCQVEATQSEDGWSISGAVLDAATRSALAQTLAAHLPQARLDLAEVTVLRQDPPRLRTVAANLTGLYARPAFLAEQVSQLLNGAVLEILMEEGRWAYVRQADGYLGWAYAPYLVPASPPRPTHLLWEPVSLLRATPAGDAPLVGRLLGGSGVAVTQVQAGWAQVILAGEMAGWLPLADLRAGDSLPQDSVQRRRQIVAHAHAFVGTPYLWGGVSGMGIDCSGLAQVTHRLAGLTLPRDADMQLDAGEPVTAPFQPGDLLFFGELGAQRRITHVAISLGGWAIIHSSRSRNGVYTDDVQAVDHLRESFVGACTCVST